MPIKTRITGTAERAEIKRKAKGRHPLLQKLDSPHLAVWQEICQVGNPKGGITARELRQITHSFHPQVLKDLQDSLLVMKVGKNVHNEFKYVGDDVGRGVLIQEITAIIEVYEDENGKFGTKTTLLNSDNVIGRIVRKVATRRVHIRIPLLEERSHEDVPSIDQPELGDTKPDNRVTVMGVADLARVGGCVIEG